MTEISGQFQISGQLCNFRNFRTAGTRAVSNNTSVANQLGFPGCRHTDMERSARRHDFSRIVIHLPSAT